MRITIETSSYNPRRDGRPWIAIVTAWGNGKPDLEWGVWHGQPGSEGLLEIDAEPGEIVRYGQKDRRRPYKSQNEWAIVQADGTLFETTEPEARKHWMNRAETDNPLAHYTDDQIEAEARRRSLFG